MPTIQITSHPTSAEYDLEAQNALHMGYRRSMDVSRGYEPMRMQLHEMGEADDTAAAAAAATAGGSANGSAMDGVNEVSPLFEGRQPNEPVSPSSSSVYTIQPVSPLVISKTGALPRGSVSVEEEMARREKASMGGLIKLATHAGVK